jgi:5'(3')-deoxyribonucleotidase
MSKSRLFCDFDNTITQTTSAFCTTYSQIYKSHPDYIPPNWQNVNQWDFGDELPLLKGVEEVEKIFGMIELFQNLDFINFNTYEVLEKLNEKYEIILVSIGSFNNISFKSQYVRKNLPFITESIFLVNQGCKMNKSIVNMSGKGNVFLEDVKSNLDSVTVERKICFGDIKSWNKQ